MSNTLQPDVNAQPVVLIDAATGLPSSSTGATLSQVSGNVASGAADTGNPVKIGGVASNTTPAAVTNGQRQNVWLQPNGAITVNLVDVDGNVSTTRAVSNVDAHGGWGNAMLAVRSGGHLFNGTGWDRAKKANAVSRIASCAASTNATVTKATAGNIHKITAFNTTTTVKFLKVYNKAIAPTVGADTPVLTVAIPPNATLNETFPNGGLYFSAGIAFALTGAAPDSDTTALAAGDVVGLNVAFD